MGSGNVGQDRVHRPTVGTGRLCEQTHCGPLLLMNYIKDESFPTDHPESNSNVPAARPRKGGPASRLNEFWNEHRSRRKAQPLAVPTPLPKRRRAGDNGPSPTVKGTGFFTPGLALLLGGQSYRQL